MDATAVRREAENGAGTGRGLINGQVGRRERGQVLVRGRAGRLGRSRRLERGLELAAAATAVRDEVESGAKCAAGSGRRWKPRGPEFGGRPSGAAIGRQI